jgi:hypothetical protein
MPGGPYRLVKDGELRDIFYLTPQTGRTFIYPFPVTTGHFHGSQDARVTPIPREMLGLYGYTPAQGVALKGRIAAALPDREAIVIRAKLISLVDHVFEKPWAFPALLATPTCRKLFRELNATAGVADHVASTGADPATQTGLGALLTHFLKKAGAVAALSVIWTQYLSGKTKDYYAFYAKRVSDELALRGIAPSSL